MEIKTFVVPQIKNWKLEISEGRLHGSGGFPDSVRSGIGSIDYIECHSGVTSAESKYGMFKLISWLCNLNTCWN